MSETPASQITLGEHTFDPLATTDFRLAVERAHPNDLTPVVDIHISNIRKLLNRLAEKDVVESVSDGRRKEFRLNVAGLERIIQNHRKREEMAEFRAELEDST